MNKVTLPLIKQIPPFLLYCRDTRLSENTQKNYERYLNKFIFWLRKKDKNHLLPREFSLSLEDINAYKFYLAHSKNEKGHVLKKVSQNYYLIALRVFFNYLAIKNIRSISANKITLLGSFKSEKTPKTTDFLGSVARIDNLIQAPDITTPVGIRDRAILEVLLSSGLRVNQAKNLNRDQLERVLGSVPPSLKKYLQTRKDENRALFINFRSRRNTDRRLTTRSIERVVNKYGRKIGLPFLTPETLRWGKAFSLSNEEVKIQASHTHKSFILESYRISEDSLPPSFPTKQGEVKSVSPISPGWDAIEAALKKEIKWLRSKVSTLPEAYKENPSFLKCDDCILRKIAILIVSGRAKASEFRGERNNDLWHNLIRRQRLERRSRHGQEWHRRMMDAISKYFETQKYGVVLEPSLDYGRADLGIYLNSNHLLYIEIGTVSLFKLWYNLSTRKGTNFLIVPSKEYAIELKS